MGTGLEYLRLRRGVSYSLHLVHDSHLAVGYDPKGKLLSLEYDGEQLYLDYHEAIKIYHDL